MRNLFYRSVAAVCLAAAPVSQAAAMTVQPVVLDLQTSGRGMSQVITVENTFSTPLPVELQPAGPGHSIGDADVPTPGTWTVTVTVRLDEFTALTADTTFPVR